ncbi:hypothetical protein ZTR_10502 [Talaromyces verruculosus]|nr:hypothetical protein ZTR_10502 [Talaromyces verruculosus]
MCPAWHAFSAAPAARGLASASPLLSVCPRRAGHRHGSANLRNDAGPVRSSRTARTPRRGDYSILSVSVRGERHLLDRAVVRESQLSDAVLAHHGLREVVARLAAPPVHRGDHLHGVGLCRVLDSTAPCLSVVLLYGWYVPSSHGEKAPGPDTGLTPSSEECNTPLSTQRALIGLWFSAVMDMVTDLCILAIPCSLLPAIRRSLSRAEIVRVAIVLLLAGLIIAAAIVRIVITNVHPHNPELSSLLFWSSVEASVSVMICSILSVGRLFRAWHDKRRQTTFHLEQWPNSGATLHRPTEPHTLPTSTTGKSWSEAVSVGSVDLHWDRQAEMHSMSEPERSYFDS